MTDCSPAFSWDSADNIAAVIWLRCANHNYFMRQPADLGIAYCCVFGLVKVWVISILYTDQMADTIDAQIWSFAFVSWLFAHLSTENYLKALYLPWQKTGLGCGSRWKQACVATKDIVIMKAFEEPPVSNVPHWGRGKRHPLQPTPSQEHVRGVHFGRDDSTIQAVPPNATQSE